MLNQIEILHLKRNENGEYPYPTHRLKSEYLPFEKFSFDKIFIPMPRSCQQFGKTVCTFGNTTFSSHMHINSYYKSHIQVKWKSCTSEIPVQLSHYLLKKKKFNSLILHICETYTFKVVLQKYNSAI